MAGFGRFILSIDSGNFLCARNYLISFYQNTLKRTYANKNTNRLKPKKPETTFFLFVRNIRPKIILENPNIKPSEVIKKASKEWSNLNPNEKENYKKIYNKNREIYVQELMKFQESLTEKQKHNFESNNKLKLQALNKPKKPPSAFVLYLTSKKQEKGPNEHLMAWVQSIKTNWHNLQNAEKLKFTTRATEMMTKYNEDLLKWEKDMIESGHSEVVRRKTLRKYESVEQSEQSKENI